MSTLSDKYAFRDQVVQRLHADLIGPAGGSDETLTESPLDRYIVGVLWPPDSGEQVDVADEPVEGDAQDADGDDEDTPVSQALMRYPSAAGMTFTVDLSVQATLTLQARAAAYQPEAPGGEQARPEQRSRSRRPADQHWRRAVPDLEPVPVDLRASGPTRRPLVDGLELYVLVRPPVHDRVTVTTVIVNVHEVPLRSARDEYSWFQVSLEATTSAPAVVDRGRSEATGRDDDLDSSALLYRANHTFASGHGCAATWDIDQLCDSRVAAVQTTFLPEHALLRAEPGPVRSADLRMSALGSAEDSDIVVNLRALVREYRDWIELQENAIASDTADIADSLQAVAQRHIDQATTAADRIDAGIDLLEDPASPEPMRAFRLMNAAMQLQRSRQDWIRSGAAGQPDGGADQAWYPFQLAFILLNLPGMTDPLHPDREVADLLWFPTGGGKTEAYLGLIAYTIVLRRLRDPQSSGVAVIMRYTLRLLTIQQFERATILLCALERLRSTTEDLGGPAFSIGLWVGRGATPNSLDDTRRALNKLRRGHDVNEANPMQLLRCPWCGGVLGPNEYDVVEKPDRHLRIACGQDSCDFRSGLPVHLVDEDVYRERPELLIGTVDKFAQMAWSGNARSLFARDGRGHRPELIIQDELHLISGPLGSMVGLYETAVEAACSVPVDGPTGSTDSKPKVIASTATIRRAEAQVRAVFARAAAQFPPPGLDPDRSFFAAPAPADRLGNRLYVGVMAPGASHQTLMIRVYASLLQSATDIPAAEATRDPYWTLLGYFSSLRVLGSASLQVQDDVRTRLDVLAGRTGTAARHLGEPSELTSRVGPREIPEHLKQLEVSHPDPRADDVVLATNMISVGLDVDRLGLMAVMGQPQSSAEYIQATSRVGRKHPGLVVTMLNSARSRDRSHYENFLPFHQSIYRAVEATSATPFAARARDRGLHGVLTALVRTLFDDLSLNNGAGRVDGQDQKLTAASAIICARAAACSDDGGETEEQLEELVRVWLEAASVKPGLLYRDKTNWEAALLVDPADMIINPDIPGFGQGDVPWPTLQSLRDVDAESTLYQIPYRRSS